MSDLLRPGMLALVKGLQHDVEHNGKCVEIYSVVPLEKHFVYRTYRISGLAITQKIQGGYVSTLASQEVVGFLNVRTYSH